MVASGLLVTVVLVGVPLAYVGARLPGLSGVFALFPPAALALCVLGPWARGTASRAAEAALPPTLRAAAIPRPFDRYPPAWLSVGLFPASHLPVLLAHPSLADVRLYHGPGGLAALAAVGAAFAFWLRASRPRLVPAKAFRTAPASLVSVVTWGVATLLVGAYLVPALRPHTAPEGALLAIALGVLTVVLVVGWGGAARLDVLFEPERRALALADLHAAARPTGARLTLAVLAIAIGSGLALAWYLGGLG